MNPEAATDEALVAEVAAARRDIAQARAERLLADDHIADAFARLNRAELAVQRARYERYGRA